MTVKTSGCDLQSNASISASVSPYATLDGNASGHFVSSATRYGSTSIQSKSYAVGPYPIDAYPDLKGWFRADRLQPELFDGSELRDAWDGISPNAVSLENGHPNDRVEFGRDSDRTPYLSWTTNNDAFLISRQAVSWGRDISIMARFRPNDRDQHFRPTGSIFSLVLDRKHGHDRTNIPLDVSYMADPGSNQITIKAVDRFASSCWTFDVKNVSDWHTLALSLGTQARASLNGTWSKPDRITRRSGSDFGIEDGLSAAIAVGFDRHRNGRLNADINELAIFDRMTSRFEMRSYEHFMNDRFGTVVDLRGQSSCQASSEVVSDVKSSFQSSSELVSQREYHDPSDISSIDTWSSAQRVNASDGDELQTWDDFHPFGSSNRATYHANDSTVKGFPSISFESSDRWSDYPASLQTEQATYTIHLLGYISSDGVHASVERGLTTELLSLEWTENDADSTKADLKVRTNRDFVTSRYRTYNALVTYDDLFLLTLEINDTLSLYVHDAIHGRTYYPSVDPASSLLVSSNDSGGAGRLERLEANGFLSLHGGTWSEIIAYPSVDAWVREFVWKYIYQHYFR